MKICFYNWTQPNDSFGRGGGVAVYQKNILQNAHLISNNIFFISSGINYRYPFNKPFFIQDNNNYTIYNSNVLAPADKSYGSSYQILDEKTELVFIQIINNIKDVDIIHFNNFEGLPINLLKRIKETFPRLKIVYSAHNYYPLCPNVALWKNDQENCIEYHQGRDCLDCCSNNQYPPFLTKYNYQDTKTLISYFARACKKWQYSFSKRTKNVHSQEILNQKMLTYFSSRRNVFVQNINKYIDKVLCVSERVRNIYCHYGVNREITETQYIGTEHAQIFNSSLIRTKTVELNKQNITIAYIGYMRKDKGFGFFLDCLSKISERNAKKINLIIAARNTDNLFYEKMYQTAQRFNQFTYYNGYTHENLDSILINVDLGIIPPIWEDNLPQVAIELHCRKIPLLCSDSGGASELHYRNPNFTFKSNSVHSFIEKLDNLLSPNTLLNEYWDNILNPISMEEHILSLKYIYLDLIKASPTKPPSDTNSNIG